MTQRGEGRGKKIIHFEKRLPIVYIGNNIAVFFVGDIAIKVSKYQNRSS